MKNKQWTREEIKDKLNNALYACDIIRVKSKNNGDVPLSIDSFDWYNLWGHLGAEFGMTMNFDPRDGLMNTPNITLNIITDFLYKNLNVQKKAEQINSAKKSFRNALYSPTKERY